jgi:hypothetical protein
MMDAFEDKYIFILSQDNPLTVRLPNKGRKNVSIDTLSFVSFARLNPSTSEDTIIVSNDMITSFDVSGHISYNIAIMQKLGGVYDFEPQEPYEYYLPQSTTSININFKDSNGNLIDFKSNSNDKYSLTLYLDFNSSS